MTEPAPDPVFTPLPIPLPGETIPEPSEAYTYVIAPLGVGTEITYTDFLSLTPVPVRDIRFNWQGLLRVTFQTTTPFPVTLRRAIRRKIMATSTANEALRATITKNSALIDAWNPDDDEDLATIVARMALLSAQVRALAQLLDP